MSYIKRLYSCIEGIFWSNQLKNKKEMSLGSILERQTSRFRDKPLIIFEDRITSYTQFNETANTYAHFFQKRGFIKGDTVALFMGNRPEFLLIHSGLAKIGVIPALLNSTLAGKELVHAINIVEPRALIMGHECMNEFLKIKNDVKLKKPGSIFIETEGGGKKIPSGMEDLRSLALKEPVSNPSTLPPVNSKDVIEYIYTSGVTALPRAVEVKQQKWLQLGFTAGGRALRSVSDDTQYLCLPLYNNLAINIAWPVTLLHGGTLVLAREFSAESFWDDIKKSRATLWLYNGEMCMRLYNRPPGEEDSRNTLKFMLGTGLRTAYWSGFKKRFGIEKIIEIYALSEGPGMLLNIKGIPGMAGRINVSTGKPGVPVSYITVKNELVRDAAGLAVKCRPGESGMYLASGSRSYPFPGYKNDKVATAAHLTGDVMKKGDNYFISGDIFKMHKGGYVSFSERSDDIFIWKGEEIFPGELSDVIARYGISGEVCVYGVNVKNMQGLAPMAAFPLLQGKKPDMNDFGSYITENLSVNKGPYFIRIMKEKDYLRCSVKQKTRLQKEGYNPELIKDQLYFLDPESRRYVRITKKVYDDIRKGIYKF
jgi:acyl-CoA synthetase (AMP-forming)/AMP-acid ligase II